MAYVGGSALIGTREEQTGADKLFSIFYVSLFSKFQVFFSRVLSGSQNDGISTSEEHMLCQCRVCCQLFLSEITEDHLLLQVSLVLAQSISLVTPGSSLKS